jgi:hypothetical protein
VHLLEQIAAPLLIGPQLGDARLALGFPFITSPAIEADLR